MVAVYLVEGGPHGKDLKPGPVYRMDGSVLLICKEPFNCGDNWRPDVFLYPDGEHILLHSDGSTSPGVDDQELADFWNGFLPFYQDED